MAEQPLNETFFVHVRERDAGANSRYAILSVSTDQNQLIRPYDGHEQWADTIGGVKFHFRRILLFRLDYGFLL